MLKTDQRPKLIPIERRHFWKLAEDWKYLGFTVPAGFMTDMDSIPRIPIFFALFKGYARYSAILHDYLYREGLVSRKDADRLFLKAMEEEGVAKWRRLTVYRTLRLTGWYRWSQIREGKY